MDTKKEKTMQYIHHYQSPLGRILLAADDSGLTGLWFEKQKYFASTLDSEHVMCDLPLFQDAMHWLDLYFAGQKPDFDLPLHMTGTAFQKEVWKSFVEFRMEKPSLTEKSPGRLPPEEGWITCPAQAVGGAVGHNPVSIIVPCHRVIGANGSLTGYAGGMEKKLYLLNLEGAEIPPIRQHSKEE